MYSKLNTLVNLIYTKGIDHGFIRPRVKGSTVLMYHGIDKSGNTRFNPRFIAQDTFEQQLLYFAKYFNIVSLEDLFGERISKTRHNIAITFDDGYENNYSYAFPLLKKYNVPATFFVTALNETNHNIVWTDLVDIATCYVTAPLIFKGLVFEKTDDGALYDKVNNISLKQYIKKDCNAGYRLKEELANDLFQYIPEFMLHSNLRDYWKLMSDEQIREISESKYLNIGSHGFWHNNLGNIPLQESVKELDQSKRYLENLTQKQISSIAYPDGSYSRELVDKSEQMGFKHQLAVDYLFEDDKLDNRIRNRFGIYPMSWSLNMLGYIISQRSK
ncbi:MAG: polysaccharide deacetylase family protein [Saprospiraceae bacterium]